MDRQQQAEIIQDCMSDIDKALEALDVAIERFDVSLTGYKTEFGYWMNARVNGEPKPNNPIQEWMASRMDRVEAGKSRINKCYAQTAWKDPRNDMAGLLRILAA